MFNAFPTGVIKNTDNMIRTQNNKAYQIYLFLKTSDLKNDTFAEAMLNT